MINLDNLKPGKYYCSSYNGFYMFILLVKPNGEVSTPTFITDDSIKYDYNVYENTYLQKDSQTINRNEFYRRVTLFKERYSIKHLSIKTN